MNRVPMSAPSTNNPLDRDSNDRGGKIPSPPLFPNSCNATSSFSNPSPVYTDFNHDVHRSLAAPIQTFTPSYYSPSAKSVDLLSGGAAASFNEAEWGILKANPKHKQIGMLDSLEYEVIENSKVNSTANSTVNTRSVFEDDDLIEAPDYIEVASSFYSDADKSSQVFQNILKVFENNFVDFEVKEERKQIRAMAYVNGSPVSFRVFLYKNSAKSGKKQKFVVEIQKREGCCFAFRTLYKNLTQQLDSNIHSEELVKAVLPVIGTVDSKLASSLAPLALGKAPAPTSHCAALMMPNLSSMLDADTINLLLLMVQSECIQSQREGLRTLVCASTANADSAVLAITNSSDLTASLLSTLSCVLTNCENSEYSQDLELIRCSLTFFSNLVDKTGEKYDKIRASFFSDAAVSSNFILSIYNFLDTSPQVQPQNSLIMSEVKRQAARLLAALAKFNKAQVLEVSQAKNLALRDLLEKLNVDDKRLAEFIVSAQQSLF